MTCPQLSIPVPLICGYEQGRDAVLLEEGHRLAGTVTRGDRLFDAAHGLARATAVPMIRLRRWRRPSGRSSLLVQLRLAQPLDALVPHVDSPTVRMRAAPTSRRRASAALPPGAGAGRAVSAPDGEPLRPSPSDGPNEVEFPARRAQPSASGTTRIRHRGQVGTPSGTGPTGSPCHLQPARPVLELEADHVADPQLLAPVLGDILRQPEGSPRPSFTVTAALFTLVTRPSSVAEAIEVT